MVGEIKMVGNIRSIKLPLAATDPCFAGQWQAAINANIESLGELGTWTEIDIQPGLE